MSGKPRTVLVSKRRGQRSKRRPSGSGEPPKRIEISLSKEARALLTLLNDAVIPPQIVHAAAVISEPPEFNDKPLSIFPTYLDNCKKLGFDREPCTDKVAKSKPMFQSNFGGFMNYNRSSDEVPEDTVYPHFNIDHNEHGRQFPNNIIHRFRFAKYYSIDEEMEDVVGENIFASYPIKEKCGFCWKLYDLTITPELKSFSKLRSILRALIASAADSLVVLTSPNNNYQLVTTEAMPAWLEFINKGNISMDLSVHTIRFRFVRDISSLKGLSVEDAPIVDSVLRHIFRGSKISSFGGGYHVLNKDKCPEALPSFATLSDGVKASAVLDDRTGVPMLKLEPFLLMQDKRSVLDRLGYIKTLFKYPLPRYHALNSEIQGTTILARYNNRPYKVSGIDMELSPKAEFPDKKILRTFMSYYKRKYNEDIQFPDQPLLRCSSMEEGSPDNVVLIPELCHQFKIDMVTETDLTSEEELLAGTREYWGNEMQSFIKLVKQAGKELLHKWKITILTSSSRAPR